ncbi:MAG: type II toxin-antitoxin system HicB family antitoxin [Treponema sp.]|nr:type II toxin-antitoxin system HicB family antitoxin [Treponema sp.]
MSEKTITMRIDDKLHTDIKIEAARKGVSIKDYIVELVLKDLHGEEK